MNQERSKLEQAVIAALKNCYDPEIPVDIYELGLIYDLKIDENADVWIDMTLTSPACPVGPQIMGAVHSAALHLEEVEDVDLQLVWTPPWDPRKMASEEVRMQLGIWD